MPFILGLTKHSLLQAGSSRWLVVAGDTLFCR